MAGTIHINLTVLEDTHRKIGEIASATFLRNKGNVVDMAVNELWKKLHPEEPAQDILVVSGEALQKEP